MDSAEQRAHPPKVLSVETGRARTARDLDWLQRNIPCEAACPARTDIPGYLEAIAAGEFDEAYRINLRDNVFPSVLGRVCARPCEPPCRHGWPGLGEPVAICWSKRSAADFARREQPVVLPPWYPPSGRRVAVVGGGPAGLAAARDLRLLGHSVVVFERDREPGGLLRTGIPAFRLPREIVEAEIEQVVAHGVEVRCGVAVGRDVALDELLDRFDGVIVATGADRPVIPALPGSGARGVEHGLSFLREANCEGRTAVGRAVVVIGGGFTALDCARMAIRFGAASVTIAYRRGPEDMVVAPGEREEADEEGVRFIFHAAPMSLTADREGRVVALRMIRTRPGEPDERGRRRPVTVAGEEFELTTDHVVLATGQTPDLTWLPEPRPERLLVCGDAAAGSSNLIEAIADGRRAAAELDARLTGARRVGESGEVAEGRGVTRTRADDAIGRHAMPRLALNARGRNDEVETGYSNGAAREEARRCYLCHYKYEIDMSRCIYCDQCVEVKPREACIVKVAGVEQDAEGRITRVIPRAWRLVPPIPPHAYFIQQTECIRCDLCRQVCPVHCISVHKVSWTIGPTSGAPTPT